VAEEGALRDVGLLGDVRRRRLVEAALGEKPRRGRHQFVAGVLLLALPPTEFLHHCHVATIRQSATNVSD
jgi:hypothetical protein